MRTPGQRGILLLPVALTLAVVGMLAYTMTQEGSMNVSAVDAQYDIERARYLAASGVQLAKWRAAKDDCDEDDLDFDKVLEGIKFFDGSIALGNVVFKTVDMGGGNLTVSLVATTERGTVHALTRKEQVVDLTEVKSATIIGPGDADTTIVKNNPAGQSAQASADTLTATAGNAYPLLLFELPADLDRASIIEADLKLTKRNGNAMQQGRSLAVHRVTRAWSAASVSWTTPWVNEGGDYVDTATDRVVIDPLFLPYNGAYTWHIESLAQSWANYRASNHGVLLKPTNLANVQFVSFNGANKPELVLRYYKRCT